MRYSQRYQHAPAKAYVVTRRCRRCEQHYETSDQDPDTYACAACTMGSSNSASRSGSYGIRSPSSKSTPPSAMSGQPEYFSKAGTIGWSTKTLTRCTSRRYGGRRY